MNSAKAQVNDQVEDRIRALVLRPGSMRIADKVWYQVCDRSRRQAMGPVKAQIRRIVRWGF